MTDLAALSLADRCKKLAAQPAYTDAQQEEQAEALADAATELRSLQAENERLKAKLAEEEAGLLTWWESRAHHWKAENAALGQRLAATESVAKRFHKGYRPRHGCWQYVTANGAVTGPKEPMSDAEHQVLERLNEPSDG